MHTTSFPIMYQPIGNVDNSCFKSDYLISASPEEIDIHRTVLSARCRYNRSAARYVAMYIYEETRGVFDTYWSPTDIHKWLQKEFGFPASRDCFYKACHLFPNYINRR